VFLQVADIYCTGIGPVVLACPKAIDFGRVPLLDHEEKTIVLMNESLIAAHFTCCLVLVYYTSCNYLKVKNNRVRRSVHLFLFIPSP